MSEFDTFEEEDFQSRFNGKTFRRILGLTRPYWKWVAGFLTTILLVSGLDSYFTYLTKQIIDVGIAAEEFHRPDEYLLSVRRSDNSSGDHGFHLHLSGRYSG